MTGEVIDDNWRRILQVCARHVEPFGQEVEQLQVIALLQALQVRR